MTVRREIEEGNKERKRKEGGEKEEKRADGKKKEKRDRGKKERQADGQGWWGRVVTSLSLPLRGLLPPATMGEDLGTVQEAHVPWAQAIAPCLEEERNKRPTDRCLVSSGAPGR